MKHGSEIEQWVLNELGWTKQESRREQLQKLLADLHKHPDSASLPVGSTERLIARSHEKTVTQRAMDLGYEPPEQAIKEMGLHVVELGLGL